MVLQSVTFILGKWLLLAFPLMLLLTTKLIKRYEALDYLSCFYGYPILCGCQFVAKLDNGNNNDVESAVGEMCHSITEDSWTFKLFKLYTTSSDNSNGSWKLKCEYFV